MDIPELSFLSTSPSFPPTLSISPRTNVHFPVGTPDSPKFGPLSSSPNSFAWVAKEKDKAKSNTSSPQIWARKTNFEEEVGWSLDLDQLEQGGETPVLGLTGRKGKGKKIMLVSNGGLRGKI